MNVSSRSPLPDGTCRERRKKGFISYQFSELGAWSGRADNRAVYAYWCREGFWKFDWMGKSRSPLWQGNNGPSLMDQHTFKEASRQTELARSKVGEE